MSEQKRKPPDWEAIEREYRVGQLSLREIGRIHGVSDTAIRKKAKEKGWARDLSQQVREKVRADLVRGEVREPHAHANDQEAVSEAAARGVEVVRSHRKDLAAGRSLVELLFTQLKEAASNREELEEEIFEETEGDKSPKRRYSLMKLVSLPTHAKALSDLSSALKNLIPLERRAFNLDEEKKEAPEEGSKMLVVPADSEDWRALIDGEEA